MVDSPQRSFLETVLSYYTNGEMDKFFGALDAKIQWVIHGKNAFTGVYGNLEEVKKGFQRFYGMLAAPPKQRLRYLIVEGTKAAAFLYDDVVGKDGKNYTIDYWFTIHLAKDNHKIVKIDNFMDCLQMQNVVQASDKDFKPEEPSKPKEDIHGKTTNNKKEQSQKKRVKKA